MRSSQPSKNISEKPLNAKKTNLSASSTSQMMQTIFLESETTNSKKRKNVSTATEDAKIKQQKLTTENETTEKPVSKGTQAAREFRLRRQEKVAGLEKRIDNLEEEEESLEKKIAQMKLENQRLIEKRDYYRNLLMTAKITLNPQPPKVTPATVKQDPHQNQNNGIRQPRK